MRCEVHCPPEGGALAGAAAVGVLVVMFAVVASAVAAVVASVAEALAVTVLSACAAGSVVVVRLVKYGDRREVFRRHRRTRVRHAQRPAITTGRRAIEGGRIEVTPDMVLGKAKEEAR